MILQQQQQVHAYTQVWQLLRANHEKESPTCGKKNSVPQAIRAKEAEVLVCTYGKPVFKMLYDLSPQQPQLNKRQVQLLSNPTWTLQATCA